MISGPIPEDEVARLEVLERYAILDTVIEQDYEDVTALASYICGTPIALVTLVAEDRQWFKSERGLGTTETSRVNSFCAHTVVTSRTLIVKDALLDERFADNPLVLGDPKIRFYAGSPLIEPGGHVLGTVCVIDTKPREMTQEQIQALEALSRQVMARMELRLKVAEELRRAEALRTAEKLAVVGRLASSVAHEINNPLQSLTNLLFMAELADREHRSQYIAQAQDELARVTQIVTQTLRFHRQSDKAAAVQLIEIVDSVLLLFQTRLKHASAQVEVQDRQSVALVCYASDLRQVVANLIGNAMDAVNGLGGQKIWVRIRDCVEARTGRPGVRLTIADSGAGMSAVTQMRLFEPFYSTKGARGTGLGLWVSKGILDKHQATLKVRSAQGPRVHGTVFAIFLPTDMDCGE